MTRINIVDPSTLTDKHLLAAYREHPRMFKFAYDLSQKVKPWTNRQPTSYTLGKGHMLFFADKLSFIANMQKQIVVECLRRGFNVQFTECLFAQWQGKIPAGYWKDYEPTAQAVQVNVERINKRLSGDKT